MPVDPPASVFTGGGTAATASSSAAAGGGTTASNPSAGCQASALVDWPSLAHLLLAGCKVNIPASLAFEGLLPRRCLMVSYKEALATLDL